jgi:hypothetical protein
MLRCCGQYLQQVEPPDDLQRASAHQFSHAVHDQRLCAAYVIFAALWMRPKRARRTSARSACNLRTTDN